MKFVIFLLVLPILGARFIPSLIHQTVKDKANLSCEMQSNIATWKNLNPTYTHHLWDDADIRSLVKSHYPKLVPWPFDAYRTGTERSDVFRVLVLHNLGGVYADIDTACLQPIDSWPDVDNARALLGVEYYSTEKDNPKLLNWAMAAAPRHTLFSLLPDMFEKAIIREFFVNGGNMTHAQYINGIVQRTGPNLLSEAADVYIQHHGKQSGIASIKESNIPREGLRLGTMRLLPRGAFGQTCGALHDRPIAAVCHQYWGNWKLNYPQKSMTYGNCAYTK